jgi:hypothetical protein
MKNNLYTASGEDMEPGFPANCEDLEEIIL